MCALFLLLFSPCLSVSLSFTFCHAFGFFFSQYCRLPYWPRRSKIISHTHTHHTCNWARRGWVISFSRSLTFSAGNLMCRRFVCECAVETILLHSISNWFFPCWIVCKYIECATHTNTQNTILVSARCGNENNNNNDQDAFIQRFVRGSHHSYDIIFDKHFI